MSGAAVIDSEGKHALREIYLHSDTLELTVKRGIKLLKENAKECPPKAGEVWALWDQEENPTWFALVTKVEGQTANLTYFHKYDIFKEVKGLYNDGPEVPRYKMRFRKEDWENTTCGWYSLIHINPEHPYRKESFDSFAHKVDSCIIEYDDNEDCGSKQEGTYDTSVMIHINPVIGRVWALQSKKHDEPVRYVVIKGKIEISKKGQCQCLCTYLERVVAKGPELIEICEEINSINRISSSYCVFVETEETEILSTCTDLAFEVNSSVVSYRLPRRKSTVKLEEEVERRQQGTVNLLLLDIDEEKEFSEDAWMHDESSLESSAFDELSDEDEEYCDDFRVKSGRKKLKARLKSQSVKYLSRWAECNECLTEDPGTELQTCGKCGKQFHKFCMIKNPAVNSHIEPSVRTVVNLSEGQICHLCDDVVGHFDVSESFLNYFIVQHRVANGQQEFLVLLSICQSYDSGVERSPSPYGTEQVYRWINVKDIQDEARFPNWQQSVCTYFTSDFFVEQYRNLACKPDVIEFVTGRESIWAFKSNHAYFGVLQYNNMLSEGDLNYFEKCARNVLKKAKDGKYRGSMVHAVKKRTKVFFGASYFDYASGKTTKVDSNVDPIPEWLKGLWIKLGHQVNISSSKIVEHDQFNHMPDMVVFNFYEEAGSNIGSHVDSKSLFERPIVSLRLFSDSALSFGCYSQGLTKPKQEIPLHRGVTTIMEGYAADNTTHCIRSKSIKEFSASIIFRFLTKEAKKDLAALRAKGTAKMVKISKSKFLDSSASKKRKLQPTF
eukprot:Nk52_evm44s223 gene=Nk52_evmTU44s223